MPSEVSATGRSPLAINGIAYMLVGIMLMGLNNAFLKLLTESYPPGELLFFRGLFVFLPVAVMIWREGGVSTLRFVSAKGHAMRAGLVVCAAFLFVNGLPYLPLADITAILFAGPLFLTAMAGPFLRERVDSRRWIAVIAGFFGILVIIRPTEAVFQVAVLLPLGAALLVAMRDILTRRLTALESSSAILLTTTTAIVAVGACTLPFAWRTPTLADFALMALCGILFGFGHFCTIETFRHAEAALVSPFKYTAILWAVGLGYLFWGHLPDPWVAAGAAVVVASGVYLLRREYALRR